MVVKQFDIMSIGDSPVNIEGLHIESDVASFTILTDLTETRLMAGEMVQVDVAFEPLAANVQSGMAVVTSDSEFPP